MPNGHDYSKEYGPHKFDEDIHHTSDCKNKCGCWMGPARSGGPTGVDPFGECPKNPKDGKLIGGNADQDVVIERRIMKLESRAYKAEERLKSVKPSKIKLAEDFAAARKELAEKDRQLGEARRVLG